jgi:DNA polymerase I-like protein with 3'-5' exonuclease and polymerase domains
MTWKDLSELHLASLETENDDLLDKVLGGKIAEAIWEIDTRKNAATLATSLGNSAGVAASEDVLKAFGVERFVDMGEPVPPEYLVKNFVEKGHPTYIYGGRGTLKSMAALVLGIAIASPDVSKILGYDVDAHGPVVLFDSELNANVFKGRAAALCNGLRIKRPADLYYMNVVGEPPHQSFPKLHEFCDLIKATAAIVDSFGFAVRGDPESYRDTRNNATEYIDPLIAKGIAVVLVEHMPHQGKHIFGSVAKEYHGRYIFRVEDLDGTDRVRGERNTRLINEKASFTDEGQKTTLLTKFKGETIVIEPQGVPDAAEEPSDASPEVKVRRSLMVTDKTAEELSTDTELSYDYLRNKILPGMRNRKEIFKVGTKGQGSAIVWGLNPPDNAATHATLHREVAANAASEGVVTTPEGMVDLVGSLAPAGAVVLDLETMPPSSWLREGAADYKKWRKKLKNKPKPERQRAQWDKFKNAVYKKYATDTDTAIPRLISVATHSGVNKLVDLNEVSPATLLDTIQNKTLITHNGGFDLGVLRTRYGYVHEGQVLDTQLLYLLHHYAEDGKRDKPDGGMWKLVDPRDTKVDLYGEGKKTVGMTSLAHVAHCYLGTLLKKGAQKSDWSVPALTEEQVRYALQDTSVLIELSDVLVDKLTAIGMGEIVKLEARCFPALVDMSLNGFPASKEVALEMAEKYRVESEEKLKKVCELLPQEKAPDGSEWAWSKAAHIRDVLRLLGANIDKKAYPKTDNTGEPSTSSKALRTIKKPAVAAAWVEAYLEYQDLHKRHRDCASQYAALIRRDGTIKGRFDTVSTGRLSCRKPNLQQVPKRGELQKKEGMRIRNIFRPAEGDKFVVADFAQAELLLAATIAKRETSEHGYMLEIFQKAEVDIHTATAATMTDKAALEVTPDERLLAKAVSPSGCLLGRSLTPPPRIRPCRERARTP